MDIKEYNKFKINKGITDKEVCEAIKCSRPTLLRKKRKDTFTLDEINLLINKFEMSKEDFNKIFLSQIFTF